MDRYNVYEMIRISEFSPAVSSTKSPQAKCKVVINNTTNTVKERELPNNDVPSIPNVPVIDPLAYPSTYANIGNVDNMNNDGFNYEPLYKHLAISFSNILKNNNAKLIVNLIDQSGKIILTAEDLADAIALLLNVDRNSIVISYEDPEAGCLAKANPVKNISEIKVNGYDFKYAYNRQHNMLSSMFSVSLTKTILL